MPTKVFFPQAALDIWVVDGTIDLRGAELVVVEQNRTFKVVEAVRVLAEVTGTPDPFELVGCVKPKDTLVGLGAEIVESSMIVGDNAYDVVPGWLGAPDGANAADEELLRSLQAKVA
jgi:hypothetical protein